ncbi:Uncharacterised protein [Mycobacteroides abscessus subsp. massiliense]|uniref:hypothetical protein n=1 Tax=Mycobacteroides abscessus TaxID=36809 RepID=UPI0009A60F0E|nr:hypothetical protein [Mycobacteroides abscessus]SKU70632.1 Uncharacterised protein [Mycobacteroides abscessus subsp. massiliense]SKU76264.1 Uncharacterised protein [Mycobacteroides abscessus subsp. massiliense]SLF33234.1 Uncharacterised protein [Mycobacteroides abscessus subsp. bolletii]SPX87701.1 Uncharacterised protein [Mycobacteroides abscessus]
MTDPLLYDQDPPDEEDFIVCWMAPVLTSAVERKLDDPLPFCEVTGVSGDDNPDAGTSDPVVQLDFYGLGAEAAKAAAKQGHRRMNLLFRTCATVTMSDGALASPDFGTCLIRPFRMPFEHDQIVRYTARYQLGLSYVTVT